MRGERSYYNKEICQLWAILGVFQVTYLARSLWDILTDPKHGYFSTMLVDIIVGILCDFIPLMILMAYHYRNFLDAGIQSTSGESFLKTADENYLDTMEDGESKDMS